MPSKVLFSEKSSVIIFMLIIPVAGSEFSLKALPSITISSSGLNSLSSVSSLIVIESEILNLFEILYTVGSPSKKTLT